MAWVLDPCVWGSDVMGYHMGGLIYAWATFWKTLLQKHYYRRQGKGPSSVCGWPLDCALRLMYMSEIGAIPTGKDTRFFFCFST